MRTIILILIVGLLVGCPEVEVTVERPPVEKPVVKQPVEKPVVKPPVEKPEPVIGYSEKVYVVDGDAHYVNDDSTHYVISKTVDGVLVEEIQYIDDDDDSTQDELWETRIFDKTGEIEWRGYTYYYLDMGHANTNRYGDYVTIKYYNSYKDIPKVRDNTKEPYKTEKWNGDNFSNLIK